ncbi:MAG: Ig-like domain repeat protein [Chloroflexi bacterium]|nr:Ig-like domain repeat protein [Chloroflexota bacterium]
MFRLKGFPFAPALLGGLALLFPMGSVRAEGIPAVAAEKSFTIEVSRNGFTVVEGPVHQMKGETHLSINQGDQVTMTLVYADTDYGKNNPHRIALSKFGLDSGLLDADNPRRTITFVARRDGDSFFRCVKVCEGHKRLQAGKLMVQAVAGAVAAQPTRLALDVPRDVERGEPAALAAVLTDATGRPVQGEPVRFLAKTNFFLEGWMVLGEVTTDSSGVAVLTFRPAQSGDVNLMVAFPGDSAYRASEASAAITEVGVSRLYRTEGGIQLPGTGVQGTRFGAAPGFRIPPFAAIALTFIILAIWSTYFFVVSQVYRISQERE